MKRFISDFIYKKVMIPGLSKLVNENVAPRYEKGEPITVDEGARLSFIVWGDPQISFISPLRSARVYAAARDLKHIRGTLDALVLAGDIAEYGTWAEYLMMHRLLEGVEDKFSSFFSVSGNHDVRLKRYKKQLKKFNEFIDLFKNGIHGGSEHYYFSHDINGYKFIFMGADKTSFEASYIGEGQLDWLDRELKENEKTGKPAFVFNHQPLRRTNGLPDAWLGNGDWRGDIGAQSDKVKDIFEKYNNIIFITGHLHYGTSAYNYQDLGKIKAVSVPTVGVINHGDNSTPSQGFIFSVYDDKITVKARYHGEGRFMGEEIVNREFIIEL